MATAWDEIRGNAVVSHNTADSLDGRRLSAFAANTLPELTKREPTKGHEAAMTEFAIRWPCPKDTDPEFYEARLSLLMRDCAGLTPSLFRKAGDRVAIRPGRPNVLPSASEIVEAAYEILAERANRQRVVEFQQARAVIDGGELRPVNLDDTALRYAEINRQQRAEGKQLFFTATGEQFMEGPHERRRVRPDGTVALA